MSFQKRVAKKAEKGNAGRAHLGRITRLQQKGWQVLLIYLALPNVEMSKMRVAERVEHGGHGVPEPILERRFGRSLRNLFTLYSHQVNRCLCFMNHGDTPDLVFEQQGKNRDIFDPLSYELLVRRAEL